MDLINETIQMQRKRMQERENKMRNDEINKNLTIKKKNEDILALREDASSKNKKRESKRKHKKQDEIEESKSIDPPELPQPIENEEFEEDDLGEMKLYEGLSHSLNDDDSLFQIDDVDLNHIIFNCKPLVLSTEEQMEAQNEAESQNIKGKKRGKENKSKSFDTFISIDNISKKKADTIGSLQSKSTSIQSVIESSCKRSIKEFLQNNSNGVKNKKSISSRRSRRIKNEIKVDEDLAENVYFDPIMSLYFYFRQYLLSEKWNERQYCCANLVWMIQTINFSTYLSSIPDLADISSLEDSLMTDLCTRGIILTLVDHFSDFQENRLIAPVRELSVKLLLPSLHIIPMTNICITILSSSKLYWMYKYNVLLLLKTLLSEGQKIVGRSSPSPKVSAIEEAIKEIKANHKVLDNVWKWLRSEDEVKILAWEWIELMVETLLETEEWGEGYGKMLEEVLEESDDIECTAISVFNLLIRIAKHEKFDWERFIDLTKTLAFNFHRMIPVRISFSLMMMQITKLEMQKYEKTKKLTLFDTDTLWKMFLLGLQTWIMEKNPLVKNWMIILKNICILWSDIPEWVSVFIQILQTRFYGWLTIQVFDNFEDFMIVSNENFEQIEGYYQLVNKPISQSEIDSDFLLRQWNGSKCLAIIKSSTTNTTLSSSIPIDLISRAPLMSSPYGPLQIPHLLFYYHLARLSPSSLPSTLTPELFIILSQTSPSTFPFPSHPKYTPLLSSLTHFFNLLPKNPPSIFTSLYSQISTSPPALLSPLLSSLYANTKSLLPQQPNFNQLFSWISEVYEVFSQIELAAARYVMGVKTVLVATVVEAGLKEAEKLNSIVRPLLAPLKSGKVDRKYLKMAGKAAVGLVMSEVVMERSKRKIVGWVIGYLGYDREVSGEMRGIKSGKVVRYFDAEVDRIQAFGGVSAFFYYYAKEVGFENVLEANDGLVSEILKEEFEQIPKGEKPILVYSESNKLYKFIMKIRALFHIWRDLNTKINIKSISVIIQSLIDYLDDILETDSWNHMILTRCHTDNTTPYTILPEQEKHLRWIPKILGEALAKDLIDRNIILGFLFKIIEVDQIDEAFKEIGREVIDTALQFAEDDDSVDFFKYLPWFIIPVLKNSSTNKYFSVLMARLFKLLPLNKAGVFDKNITEKGEFNPSEEYEQGFEFLKVLSNKRSSNKEQILKSLKTKETIREYQEHGISWIVSLTDFGFNWALWDDMGLGKTFQALASVAIKVKEKQVGKKKHNTISLVVCPSTLIHNWNNEIKKFFDESELKGDVFEEGIKGRDYKHLKTKVIPKIDILIISYEKIRAHSEFFKDIKFLYIILDEAHLIKNSKSLTTQAIKSLQADRKLILTGTPLQNRVTELWSIFDFLMPGFLEDEQVFNKKYTKYLSTNLKKIGDNEKETEQFLKSIQNLRERIAPFILRRTKENVMKELPPKILQDYKWPLSDSQAYLHDILEKMFPYTEGMKSIDTKASDMKTNKNAIENLLAHRRLCNHPNFILEDKKLMDKIHAEIPEKVINEKIKETQQGQDIYEHSGKIRSLITLLEEWGMLYLSESGKAEPKLSKKASSSDGFELETSFLAGGIDSHRALIFCQIKKFMYMIEREVMKRFQIPYLMLDATLNPKQRIEVAEKFNNHSKYKVLLLTTNIGSLGLNLTGADTVIFMEHDWNPMKDLQAIDRAHRIGQTKTVTVYRLISMGTLEEKIMNLQRFKKKLHRMLIVEKHTTGATGEDKDNKVEVSNILKSFEGQDAFNQELNKQISSSAGIQIDEDDIDNDWENFLSKIDKDWLNIDDK